MRVEFHEELNQAIKLAFLERPGMVPRVMGTWREDQKYEPLDVVAKDGALFLCKHSNPGACPGPDWQIMTVRGERGKIGPPGERGLPGPTGPMGPAGRSIVGWQIHARTFQAFPKMSDGKLGVPLDFSELFAEFERRLTGVNEIFSSPKSVPAKICPTGHGQQLFAITSGPPPEQAVVMGESE